MRKENIIIVMLTLLMFATGFQCLAQVDTIGLPDPDPYNRSDEYEVIILDGEKVLRSKITKQVFKKNVQDFALVNNASFNTDWMNKHWDNTVFDSFNDAEDKINWPVNIDFGNQTFVMPIDGVITSRYGWRKGRPHKGIDLDLVTGDNVMVVLDGKVRLARREGGFGNAVVVRHGNGLETVYAHLSKILVNTNDYVKAGQVIGKGGNTGRSYGSHLHFEMRYLNRAINPEYFIDFEDKHNLRVRDFLVEEIWADPTKHRSYKQSNIVVKRPVNFYVEPQNTFEVNNRTTTQSFETIQSQPSTQTQTFEKQQPSSSTTFEKQTSSSSFEKSNQYHTIVKGDTLAKLAQQYNTSIAQLTQLNQISKSSTLRIGQKLRVK